MVEVGDGLCHRVYLWTMQARRSVRGLMFMCGIPALVEKWALVLVGNGH
jgi:hypothetical protein